MTHLPDTARMANGFERITARRTSETQEPMLLRKHGQNIIPRPSSLHSSSSSSPPPSIALLFFFLPWEFHLITNAFRISRPSQDQMKTQKESEKETHQRKLSINATTVSSLFVPSVSVSFSQASLKRRPDGRTDRPEEWRNRYWIPINNKNKNRRRRRRRVQNCWKIVDNISKWNCWIRNDDNEQLLKPKRRTQTHATRPEEEEEKIHKSKILPQKSFTKLCPGRRRRRRRRPSRSRNRFQDLDADGDFEVLRVYGTSLFGSRLFNFTPISAVQIRCRIISAVQIGD